MFTQTTEYAIRAMIEIAKKPEGEFSLASELSENLGIPQHYLAKILQQLVRTRVLTSTRGRLGGFSLARPAKEIPLYDVVATLEDVEKKKECVLGQSVCNAEVACPLHEFWSGVREQYVHELEHRTVADLADFELRRRKAGLKLGRLAAAHHRRRTGK